ncbi:glycosyltransferase family 4 protein [Nibricoccus sp. IMCC34717]|uniref:glycosyltransferase family 4 protein n=1 Tax=Nibricoccus sp. IMCC34717 TaxID=3034021 RepID=UPI00384A8D68
MTRPRILQCVSHLDLGGAEQVAWSLASGLSTDFAFGFHAVRGVAQNVFGADLAARIQGAGLPLTKGPRVPMRRGGLITSAWGFLRSVRIHRPDLCHVHAEIPEAAVAFARVVSPSLRRLPLVRTIHNSKIWHFAPRLGAFCEKRLDGASSVAVSHAALRALHASRATAGLAPCPAREGVITNGVAQPTRQSAGLGAGRLELIFGGRFEPEKGADLLPTIAAATHLPPGRRVRLSIFGQGVVGNQLQAFATKPPPGWEVALHAPVPDLAARLPDFTAALVPSRFEGLSLFAVESILAGLPVFVTDAPGLSEALPPPYPLRAPAGDAAAFAALLSDWLARPEAFTEALALARTRAISQFDPTKMLAGYRQLYHDLLRPAVA